MNHPPPLAFVHHRSTTAFRHLYSSLHGRNPRFFNSSPSTASPSSSSNANLNKPSFHWYNNPAILMFPSPHLLNLLPQKGLGSRSSKLDIHSVAIIYNIIRVHCLSFVNRYTHFFPPRLVLHTCV